MGLDLWFREDVVRILAATHEAMHASLDAAAPTELAEAYRQGFVAALRAVGLAFGVAGEVTPGSRRPARTMGSMESHTPRLPATPWNGRRQR